MRPTIAIVDDDGGVRQSLRELLRSMGFDAVTFESAETFLAFPRRDEIDCLIADIHLPGMSGVSLLRTLADAASTLPALLISAHDDPLTMELIQQTGPVPHLRKPFSDEDLLDAIQRVLAA